MSGRVATVVRVGVERVKSLCSLPLLLEPRQVHGLDLTCLHPRGVGIDADRGAEVLAAVHQVWAVKLGQSSPLPPWLVAL
ncbi:MAG: hypothetical protein ACYC0W_07905 [Candidatus Nanopelagicales bacterium]